MWLEMRRDRHGVGVVVREYITVGGLAYGGSMRVSDRFNFNASRAHWARTPVEMIIGCSQDCSYDVLALTAAFWVSKHILSLLKNHWRCHPFHYVHSSRSFLNFAYLAATPAGLETIGNTPSPSPQW